MIFKFMPSRLTFYSNKFIWYLLIFLFVALSTESSEFLLPGAASSSRGRNGAENNVGSVPSMAG